MGSALLAWALAVTVIELHDLFNAGAIGVDRFQGHLPRVAVGLVFKADFVFGDRDFEAAVGLG